MRFAATANRRGSRPTVRLAVRLDRAARYLVVRGKGGPHAVGVSFPPTGRTLDVGEQERHRKARMSAVIG
jgi:hypothetical protein